MLDRRWKRIRKSVRLVVLFAVPGLALAAYSPGAWNAWGAEAPGAQLTQAAPSGAAVQDAVESWSDTANPVTINLVAQARQESAALNNGVRSLRSQLKNLPVGSLQAGLVLQSLRLTAAERDKWDSTWRQIGRPHVNQTTVQNALINMQSAFINANVDLVTLQAQEITQSTIFSFTPPTF